MPKYSKTAFQLKSTDGNLHALRGRLGDFIFRTRNGKIFAFYKPKQGRFIPDPISVQLREITTKLNLEIVNRKSSNRKSSWLPKRSTTDSIIEPEKSSPSSTCYSSWSASKKSTTNPFPTPILKPSSATLGNQIIVRQLRTGKLFVRKFAKPPKLWAYLHSISKNKRNMKVNLQLITASVLSFGGLVLLFCGLFIDPEGQIHESLLVAFGEVATFSGALMGIDYVYKKRS